MVKWPMQKKFQLPIVWHIKPPGGEPFWRGRHYTRFLYLQQKYRTRGMEFRFIEFQHDE